MPDRFDEQLLYYIKNGYNDDAILMLDGDLARTHADWDKRGTLLHHAAAHNNVVIARRLIELGAGVNRFRGRGTTPLVTALSFQHAAVVKVLLRAGARIDKVDNDGISALQVGLDWEHVGTKAFKLLVRKLRKLAGTSEELAEMLIRANCDMCHAATLKDVEVMECMLGRGFEIDSKNFDCDNMTALHVAIELNDLKMSDWLLTKGADIEALDKDGKSALIRAVENGNQDAVKFLLKHGAHPDLRGEGYGHAPLYTAFMYLDDDDSPDEHVGCAELLLQHGATFENSEILLRIFNFAVNCSNDRAVRLLIAHMAMLEELREPVDKSVIESTENVRTEKIFEYYERCQQVLTIKIFDKLSLLDLLNVSERKMRLMVRKETLLREVEKFNSELKLSELYPYYYNTMMGRIAKARRVVKLENEAVFVVCKIFKANDNQFYDCAQGIVEYLNERDLQFLVQV